MLVKQSGGNSAVSKESMAALYDISVERGVANFVVEPSVVAVGSSAVVADPVVVIFDSSIRVVAIFSVVDDASDVTEASPVEVGSSVQPVIVITPSTAQTKTMRLIVRTWNTRSPTPR
jgi:hypothetical protein